jgi:hypothetical protein
VFLGVGVCRGCLPGGGGWLLVFLLAFARGMC